MDGSHRARWVGAAVLGFAWCSAIGQTPSLTLIGVPSGALESRLTGVSADGRVAIGYSSSPSERGLSWTALGGLDPWGFRSDVPRFTRALGVNTDGSMVVGQRVSGLQAEGFRYDGTYHALANPAGYDQASANGVSGNGQVIAGAVSRSDTALRPGAVLWNAAGTPELIGTARASDVYASFTNISHDGSTAIGVSAPDFNGGEAYSWTRSGGWRHLPVPGSIGTEYSATPASASLDGTLITGLVTGVGFPSAALLWRNGSPTVLGSLGPQWNMSPGGISDDGSVIIGGGRPNNTAPYTAVVWLNGGGATRLEDYLTSLGITIPAGVTLTSCAGISADGRTIAGTAVLGGSAQGFVATIPTPSGAAIVLLGLTCLNVPRRRR